jgi:hypothetical protein
LDERKRIETIALINKELFYGKFKSTIESINMKIEAIKNEQKIFLNTIENALKEKGHKLFTPSEIVKIDIPQDFSKLQEDYEKIVDENNTLSVNLENEKKIAKNNLRYHEIKKALDNFAYEAENQKLKDLDGNKQQRETELNKKKTELITKQTEKQ